MKNYCYKILQLFHNSIRQKKFFIFFLIFLILVLGFSLGSNVSGQGSVEVEIKKNEKSVCTFNNTKMAMLRVVKNVTGTPSKKDLPTFYYNVIPTPSVLGVEVGGTDEQDKYTGKESTLLDPGKYSVLETVPSDFNWLMRDVNCHILPACGDEICDTSTEVGENCNSCQIDCGKCPGSSLSPPPVGPSEPTGVRIPNKNGIKDVEFIVGRTTECVFDNELISLKIVTNTIGGDQDETFNYNIKLYNSKSPSVAYDALSVITDKKVREDKIRGDEHSGSEGKFLKPAVTSYIITEEISDGWALNSVVCELQGGERTGTPTIYDHGIINVTLEPNKVTTCTFSKTKKGDIKIVKNAEKAEGGEMFDYNIDFLSTDYLKPSRLSVSQTPPKPIIKVDKNGLGSYLFAKFSAVASNGTENSSMASDNGKNWRIGETPKDKDGDYIYNDWQSVAYGKGLFVAVSNSGDGNRVMTSENGKDWIMRESPKDKDGNFIDNDWQSVTYGKGLFVAVASSGSGNRVMTSANGINWTIGKVVPKYITVRDPQSGLFTTTIENVDNDWQSVTYGKGLFVVVASSGSGNRVMTSEDGRTWETGESPVKNHKDKNKEYIDNDWQSVTYGKGLFVAVASSGSGNRVMTSANGKDWTIQKSSEDNFWQSITYGKGLFVAVASSGSGNRVMTSKNGKDWAKQNTVSNSWQSVAYGKGLFVAVAKSGSGNRVMTSDNGKDWEIRESPKDKDGNFIDNDWQGAAYFDSGIYPGVYRVLENIPEITSDKDVWSLKNVKCLLENGDQTGNIVVKGLDNVKVYAGKTTTCTFDNVLRSKTETEGFGGGGESDQQRKPANF